MTVGLAFDDTWEYDGSTATWSKLATDSAPSARIDFGFRVFQSDQQSLPVRRHGDHHGRRRRYAMQDSWEWDGAAGTWTERTGRVTNPARASLMPWLSTAPTAKLWSSAATT